MSRSIFIKVQWHFFPFYMKTLHHNNSQGSVKKCLCPVSCQLVTLTRMTLHGLGVPPSRLHFNVMLLAGVIEPTMLERGQQDPSACPGQFRRRDFPITSRMDKEDVVYIYIYIYILVSHKKEWNSAICSNMDGLGGQYVKWSKSDRERQILYDITYVWNLKSTTN